MLNLLAPGLKLMSRWRILVVDDDQRIRQLYRTALVFAGFDVDTAEDGLSALQKIDNDRPHLIVLDLQMPRVDGVDVLNELQANRYTLDIPVVVVTGVDSPPKLPCTSSVLTKPCGPEELISAIEHRLHAA